MTRRLVILPVLASLLAVACGSAPVAEPIAMPDWDAALAATRDISPVQVTTEVLVEIDEEAAGGNAMTAIVDWQSGLADISPFEPITNTQLSRIIVNGDTAYVLSSAEPFVAALPEGREIVELPSSELAGVLPSSPAELTAIFGVLQGATAARQRPSGEIEVDLDVTAAWAAMTEIERAALGVPLDGVDTERALAEVTLSPEGHIEQFRLRIEGTQGEQEFLLTGAADIAPVAGPLSFDPPPVDLVVPIDEVPAVRDLIGA